MSSEARRQEDIGGPKGPQAKVRLRRQLLPTPLPRGAPGNSTLVPAELDPSPPGRQDIRSRHSTVQLLVRPESWPVTWSASCRARRSSGRRCPPPLPLPRRMAGVPCGSETAPAPASGSPVHGSTGITLTSELKRRIRSLQKTRRRFVSRLCARVAARADGTGVESRLRQSRLGHHHFPSCRHNPLRRSQRRANRAAYLHHLTVLCVGKDFSPV